VAGEPDGAIAHAELGWPPGGGVMLGSRDERAPTHRPSGGASVYASTADPPRPASGTRFRRTAATRIQVRRRPTPRRR
jgi:hypothetical protein